MILTPDTRKEMTGDAVKVAAALIAAVRPRKGEPWGHITADEAEDIAAALVALAVTLLRVAR